jgi:hypothetical protein
MAESGNATTATADHIIIAQYDCPTFLHIYAWDGTPIARLSYDQLELDSWHMPIAVSVGDEGILQVGVYHIDHDTQSLHVYKVAYHVPRLLRCCVVA